jgi:hypothetical protein
MSQYISVEMQNQIAKRAGFRCEYCLLHERYSFLSFHIEHIISVKHGGKTVLSNLAYSCPLCNLYKGTDIAIFTSETSGLVRFFNPRIDLWTEHFRNV